MQCLLSLLYISKKDIELATAIWINPSKHQVVYLLFFERRNFFSIGWKVGIAIGGLKVSKFDDDELTVPPPYRPIIMGEAPKL